MTSRAARVALASCLAVSGACGTVYRPAPSPRIDVVVHGGGLAYLAGGRETPIGPLGGDLPSLVGADPDALRFARRSRRELAAGVPAYVCGIAAVVVGLVLAKPAGWIVAGSGAVVGGAGVGLMGAGVVNAVDAVNVYNDRVTPPPP